MGSSIRCLDFIDWNAFLEEEKKDAIFTLDFQIDAGFSFSNAIAQRKIFKKKLHRVTMDHSLAIPKAMLKFRGDLKIDCFEIHSIIVEDIDLKFTDVTEKYMVSVDFSDSKIDFDKIKKELNEEYENRNDLDKETINQFYFSNYFLKASNKIKDEIISFIELSGYFAKYTFASLNLYLNEEGSFFRILQLGGGIETAGQNSLHPIIIRKDKITFSKNEYDKIPEQYKRLFEKGIHYKFLGFYDESFLCFYKLVESLFYSEHFFNVISTEKEDSIKKQLLILRRNHSQRKMMCFIHQWIVDSKELDSKSKEEIENILDELNNATQIRNAIAHSDDQTEKSKLALPLIHSISNFLIKKTFLVNK